MIHLAWTGGFDSTFRLIGALESGESVTPHYLISYVDGRQSTGQEVETMRSLHAELTRRYPDQLKPMVWGEVSEHPESVMSAFASLNRRLRYGDRLGNQYQELACYAMANGIDLEVCAEPGGRMYNYLRNCAPTEAESAALSRLSWPVIDLGKLSMVEMLAARGLDHLLHASWSCWYPRVGTMIPCGVCEPCRRRTVPFEELQPVPYEFDVSLCVPDGYPSSLVDRTVHSFVGAMPGVSLEIVYGGELKARQKNALAKLAPVTLAIPGRDGLAASRTVTALAATGQVQVHVMPGFVVDEPRILTPHLKHAHIGFWAPVVLDSEGEPTGQPGTNSSPEGRGPWHIVAGPWWAFRRVGYWQSVTACDAEFRLRAANKGIRIVRELDPIRFKGE